MLLLLIMVSLLPLSIFAQLESYSFSELDSLQTAEEKNMVVFLHTDWCRYCQVMKNTTFTDEKIINLLNEEFWFADLNAETKQDIDFHGHTFKYKPTGYKTGTHELAEQLGTINGKMTYPTICILNAEYEIIFQYGELLSANELLGVLKKILVKNENECCP